MIEVIREFEWDMGHRVTNHASLCKNPHGHRYKMKVTVGGFLDDREGVSSQGMVIDFGLLKKLVTEAIVDKFDHSFVYWDKDMTMKKFADDNPSLRLYSLPFVPTAEMLVQYFAGEIKAILKKAAPELHVSAIELFETPKSSAKWTVEK